MINKSAEILYLFDFDGTLLGQDAWEGIIKNSWLCLKNKPIIAPQKLNNFRWAILTGRPKIDKLFVWLCCYYKGIYPTQVITQEFWRYPKTISREGIYQLKTDIIKQILDGKKKTKVTKTKIDTVFYIDSDLHCISYLNANKNHYQYQAISVFDFLNGNFDSYV